MQTRISLRSVKYAAFASEETSCFEAVVCLDGKPVCRASNDGRGGCDFHHPLPKQSREAFDAGMNEIESYIATLPRLPPCDLLPDGMPQDLETVVGELLMDHLHRKDLKRKLKSSVLFVDEDGLLYSSKPRAPATVGQVVEWMKANKPKRQILNTMSEDESFKVYLEATGARPKPAQGASPSPS